MITQRGEVKAVSEFIRDYRLNLVASSTNLFETLSIQNESKRNAEIKTLITVATKFEARPQSWHQAEEVRRALRAHYPRSLRKVAFERKPKQWLATHIRNWKRVCSGDLPAASAFARYTRDNEWGIRLCNATQKRFRQEKLANMFCKLMILSPSYAPYIRQIDPNDPEIFWRMECLLSWYVALVARHPATSDLCDWLGPYIRDGAFQKLEYVAFWLHDVNAAETPKNRLYGLNGYHQLEMKITHGNCADRLHAMHALDVDLFLSADKAFYRSLLQTASGFKNHARLLLIERQGMSVLPFLNDALKS
jgi:hypothetical protein